MNENEEISVYEIRLKFPLNGASNQKEVHDYLKSLAHYSRLFGFIKCEIIATGLENEGNLDMRIFKEPLQY